MASNGTTYDRTENGKKPLTEDDALFLSNLDEDPGETRNPRHQYPELVDQLASSVHVWRATVDSTQ